MYQLTYEHFDTLDFGAIVRHHFAALNNLRPQLTGGYFLPACVTALIPQNCSKCDRTERSAGGNRYLLNFPPELIAD
jgi:hypothetical protein